MSRMIDYIEYEGMIGLGRDEAAMLWVHPLISLETGA